MKVKREDALKAEKARKAKQAEDKKILAKAVADKAAEVKARKKPRDLESCG